MSTTLQAPRQGFPANPVLDSLCDGVIVTDTGGDLAGPAIVYVNRAACEISGYEPEEMLGHSPKMLQGPATDLRVMRRLHDDLRAGRSFNGQTVNYRKDGTPFVMEWSISTVVGSGGEGTYHVAIQRDATLPARRLMDAEHAANTDPLTGLPNRAHLDRILEGGSWLSRRARSAVVIDIDKFKAINDTYGHLVGDEVLRSFPRRLTDTVRAGDLIARWGGEEFCVLMLGESDHAAVLAERIVAAVSETPFHTSAGDLAVTASVGSASINEDRQTALELLSAADGALYTAKRRGRNRSEHV